MTKSQQPSPAALMRYFRGKRLILGQHDGDLWVTDSYMACRLNGEKNPIAALLALYNLPFEPMVCTVGPTILRDQGKEPPQIGGLIADPAKLIPANRSKIGGLPILVESTGYAHGPYVEVWDVGIAKVTMNPALVRFVHDLTPHGSWFGDPASPTTRPLLRTDDRHVTAIAMPVRSLLTMADEVAA